jgi:hypothetical protein
MATEYADFSIRGKAELTFNPNGSKTGQVHPCPKTIRVQLWRYGKLQSYCTSTFGVQIMKQLAKQTVICMNS